ncbi:MAG TPA: reverse transcriptase/maturase family protein, partial [Streptosporangiaceae bacterium]
FSDRSHGFRKGRGCHTALREVRDAWTGTVWFIEGDISDCYGSVDHQILVSILAEKIGDQRFLRLMRNMLRAGYLEDWVCHDTLSGVPQGGVASPILSCIYLDKLDKFVCWPPFFLSVKSAPGVVAGEGHLRRGGAGRATTP